MVSPVAVIRTFMLGCLTVERGGDQTYSKYILLSVVCIALHNAENALQVSVYAFNITYPFLCCTEMGHLMNLNFIYLLKLPVCTLQKPRAWTRKASAGWRMWDDENWKQFQDCRCRILPPCYNIWSFLCVCTDLFSWLHCAQQAGHRIRAFGEIFSAAFSLVKDLCSDSPRMESFKASAVIRSLLFNNGPTWTLFAFVKVHWIKQLVKSCVKQHPA